MHVLSKLSILSLALVAASAAASVLVTMPILAPAMVRQVGGGDAATGYLASADMFGLALASLVFARHAQVFDWRIVIRIALAGVVIGNLVSIALDDIALLLLTRLFVGLCGGAALSIVFVAFCHTPSPDRSFGILIFLQLLLQTVLLPLFAWLDERWGVGSLYLGLVAIALFALVLVGHAPRGLAKRAEILGLAQKPAVGHAWAVVTVVALGIYFMAPAMIWAYFEPIGRSFGLDALSIGTALGFSGLAGMLGAATVLLLPPQRMLWMIVGIALSIGALVPIYYGTGFSTFLVVACAFTFAWNFTVPYLMGVIAQYDEAGETAIYSLASQLLGLAAGPLAGSAILNAGLGYSAMISIALFVLVGSLVLFARSEALAQKLIKEEAELAI